MEEEKGIFNATKYKNDFRHFNFKAGRKAAGKQIP